MVVLLELFTLVFFIREVFPVDWVARNVYWADSGKQTIEVANMDTKGKKVLIDEQIRNPRGIAVHPSTSRLFWTDWDRNYPRIETSNLDGSNRYPITEIKGFYHTL